MSYAIELNDTLIDPNHVGGEDGITITESLRDGRGTGGGPLKAMSGTLVFYYDAWRILYEALVVPPDGKRKHVRIRIYDTCTSPRELVFDGVIPGSNVDWCHGQCYLSATAVQETEETRKADCFSSTLVSDNWNGFMEADHPKFVYCDELRPKWLHDTLLYLGLIVLLLYVLLYPIVVLVLAIVTVLNAVIDALNSIIPGEGPINRIDFDGDSTTNVLEEFTNLRDKVIGAIIGCGRRHPSPLVRSYFANACGKCGLSFESSILNNPASDYYNLAYFFAPAKRGIAPEDGVATIYENRVLKTGDVFAEDMALLFNAQWRIEGQRVRLERRDKMVGLEPWVDPAQLRAAGRLVGEVCYEWDTDDLPAFGQFEWQVDPMDACSNEARDRYNDIVEWNSPVNILQRGKKEVSLPFGIARFRGDGVSTDALDGFSGLYPQINEFDGVMLITQGVVTLPKLIIWDPNSGTAQARAARFTAPGYPYQVPNWPLLFNEVGVSGLSTIEPDAPGLGLYPRFHHIDNPRVDSTRGLRWKFTFEYLRQELVSRSLFKYVPLPEGNGRIAEIVINPDKRQITVSGTV